MNANENKLYEFYKQCDNKGYHNMQDATESLKAKVIATDLGIKYKDISKTYAEAKAVYQEEQSRREKARVLQQTPGKFLLKLIGKGESISVYKREDGSCYCTHNEKDHKYEGVPTLNLKSGGALLYTYHPSQAVYTGASSGGIHMGGVHHTKAYMDEKVSNTGTGYIDAVSGDLTLTVREIELSSDVKKRFKRDDWVKNNLHQGNNICCYNQSGSDGTDFMVKAALAQGDYYKKMSMISMAVDSQRLSMKECKERVNFLTNVFNGIFPLSDEELYAKAISMETGNTSASVKECMELFEKIADYKDSKERAEKLRTRYEEILQYEKEQAILKKEAAAAKAKKGLKAAGIIVPLIIIAAVAVGAFIFITARNNEKKDTYAQAVSLLEEGSYSGALEAFSSLGDYEDAEDMALKSGDLLYEQAYGYMEAGNYAEAIAGFVKLLEVSADDFADEEVQEMIEETKRRENLQQAFELHDVEYLMAMADAGEFKKLNGAEIQMMIVGEWNQVSSINRNKVARYDYKEDGTVVSYDGVSDGTILTYTYTIVDDYFVTVGVEHEIYDLGDGHYLKYNTGASPSATLMWNR